MPGITSYPTSMGRGFAGQIADEAPRYIRTGVNKQGAALPFGLFVKKGTNDDEVVLPTATGDKPCGILVHRHDVNTIGLSTAAADAGVPAGDRCDLLEDGVVYIKVEEAVVQRDPAYMRFQGGPGGVQKGAVRKSADANVAWAISTAYVVGDRRTNDTAKLYECITAGTSAGSGGPTGVGQDITDGTAHWKYVETVSAATAASAVLLKGAQFLESGSAGAVVPMKFSALVAQTT